MTAFRQSLSAFFRRIVPGLPLSVGVIALQGPTGTPLQAQIPDSVRVLLSSAEGRERSRGVSWLLEFPVSEWDAGHKSQIVANINREGQEEMTDPTPIWRGESRARYQIDLTKAALRIGDPAALPGIVYVGLRVNPEAKQYIASIGGQALPLLSDAYAREDELRIPAVQTVGIMLLDNGALSVSEARDARSFLLTVGAYELSYLRNAGRFPELGGIIAWAADSSQDEGVRERARRALPGFNSKLSEYSAGDLWGRELGLLATVCESDAHAHCESLSNVGAAVQGHLNGRRWTPARNGIQTFVRQLEQGCADRSFLPPACRSMMGTARLVLTKLPS